MHSHPRRMVSLLAIIVVLFAFAPRSAVAQEKSAAPITLIEQSTESDFKDSFTFTVRARSTTGNIIAARLLMRFPGDTTYSVYSADSFVHRREITADVSFNIRNSTIVPWQLVLYHWKLTDAAGHVLVTPEAIGEFEDHNTQSWHKLSDQKVSVYYYGKSDAIPKKLFAALQQAYRLLIKESGHTPQHELRLVVYNDQKAYCGFQARGKCRQWEGGAAVRAISAIWIEPEWRDPNQQWLIKEAVPHEFAHTFLQEWLGQRTLGIPDWFAEGQAVNNQRQGVEDYVRLARRLYQGNRLFPLHMMVDEGNLPKSEQRVREWYGEATSLVTFLYERWGRESLGKIMDEVYDYVPFDQALEDVTGLRIEEYEYQWRLWLKAPRTKPTPQPTPDH